MSAAAAAAWPSSLLNDYREAPLQSLGVSHGERGTGLAVFSRLFPLHCCNRGWQCSWHAAFDVGASYAAAVAGNNTSTLQQQLKLKNLTACARLAHLSSLVTVVSATARCLGVLQPSEPLLYHLVSNCPRPQVTCCFCCMTCSNLCCITLNCLRLQVTCCSCCMTWSGKWHQHTSQGRWTATDLLGQK